MRKYIDVILTSKMCTHAYHSPAGRMSKHLMLCAQPYYQQDVTKAAELHVALPWVNVDEKKAKQSEKKEVGLLMSERCLVLPKQPAPPLAHCPDLEKEYLHWAVLAMAQEMRVAVLAWAAASLGLLDIGDGDCEDWESPGLQGRPYLH